MMASELGAARRVSKIGSCSAAGQGIVLLAAALLASTAISTPALAQANQAPPAPPEADAQAPQAADGAAADAAAPGEIEVVVTGIRGSLRAATQLKRNNDYMSDVIVATDIGKLPDTNIAEALQRVTGVQITRDRGEGAGVAIRGLPQVLTTFNNRDIYSAGNGRGLNFNEVASEIVKTLEVQKSRVSSTIAGGLGGTVNIDSLRPKDLGDFQFNASAKADYPEFNGKVYPRLSGLIGGNVYTDAGRFGAYIAVSYQDRQYRWDRWRGSRYNLSGTNITDLNKNGVFPGEAADFVIVPEGTARGIVPAQGHRDRLGINGIADWSPNENLTVYVDAMWRRFRGREVRNGNFFSSLNTPPQQRWTNVTVGQDNALLTGTLTNVTVDPNTQLENRDADDYMFGTGMNWDNHNGIKVNADLSYQYGKAKSTYYQTVYRFAPVDGRLDLSIDASKPGTPIGSFIYGGNFANTANYSLFRLLQSLGESDRKQWAFQLDGAAQISDQFSLTGGWRFTTFTAENNSISLNSVPAAGIPITVLPDMIGKSIPNFLDNRIVGNIGQTSFLSPDADYMRKNLDAIRRAVGIATGDPAYNPLSFFRITESTLSPFAQLDFKLFDDRLKGNIGLRADIVHLRTTIATGMGSSNSTNWLPNVNLSYELAHNLYLRGAYYKTVTRPDFGQLSPSLTLNDVSVPKSGSGGNPDLKSTTSTAYDASIEWYFGRSNLLSLAGFYKNIDGFVVGGTQTETINGVPYQITRPRNLGSAKLKGFEVGYQQFLDFLPGLLSGFGVQANFTYVDSKVKDVFFTNGLGLVNLSRYSYNLTGLYEKGPLQMRVAYNWRSKYVNTQQTATQPAIFTDAFPWLDASISYDLNKHVSLSLEGSNLLKTMQFDYEAVRTRPQVYYVVDRTFVAGIKVKF